MSAEHEFNRFGFPRPAAGAAFVRDFGESGYAARPSLRTQKRIASAVLKLADREYEFVDEWDVDAPPEDVFDTLADATTYPTWWKPVSIDVDSDGEHT